MIGVIEVHGLLGHRFGLKYPPKKVDDRKNKEGIYSPRP